MKESLINKVTVYKKNQLYLIEDTSEALKVVGYSQGASIEIKLLAVLDLSVPLS